MAFFYNETKAEAAATPKSTKRNDIPIASLQQLGCSACPRNDDTTLKSPKMRPAGTKSPMVYLLGGSPSEAEDIEDMHWIDAYGGFIYATFGEYFMEHKVRSNFITQCMGPQTAHEIACCRNRIVADIEVVKPVFIVGIGDEPLRWATGLSGRSSNALVHRGSKFVVKIGRHVCWYIPIIFPNFVKKKQRSSEFELALRHDIAWVKSMCEGNGVVEPRFYSGGYGDGIEIITGREPGDLERLRKALQELALLPKTSLDIEATGLRPYVLKDSRILSCAIGTFERTVAFAVEHRDGWGTKHQIKQVKEMLGEFIVNSGSKCCHNLAMEMEWFEHEYGPEILQRTDWDDTMCKCHTLDERAGTKSLGTQTLMHFGFNVKGLSNLDVTRLDEYPIEDVLLYNGMDTKWTDKLRDHLDAELALNPLFVEESERKIRMAPSLVVMETRGLTLDLDYARAQDRILVDALEDVAYKLQRTPEVKKYNQRFGTFSPTAPEHVLKLMRDICNRNEVAIKDRFTDDITYTTGEEVLAKIPSDEVPSAALVLEHRGLAKLRSTYLDPVLSGKIVCRDGKVRGKYSSTIAETGRLACEDPNVMNWPKRKHKEIRGVFTAKNGSIFFAADYGQIEFRVVGMASEDENLVKYCWTGYDVHGFWAKRMMEEYPEIVDYIVEAWPEVLKEEDQDKAIKKVWRQEAKNGWVFPQLFGSSVDSCAAQLHLPPEIARDLAKEFWDEFSGVKAWQEKTLSKYEKNLYVETLGGRRRRGSLSKNQVINVPIQGCLQGHTRVLTDRGLVPIDQLVGESFLAWTGFNWRPATALDRGQCQIADITLSSGLIIHCDTRHKLKNQRKEWVEFSEFVVGDFVALPKIGRRVDWSGQYNIPYLLGAYVGDGSFYTSSTGYPRFTLSGGFVKKDERWALYQAMQALGFPARWEVKDRSKESKQTNFNVCIDGRDFADYLSSYGVEPDKNAHTKRIPSAIWTMAPQDQADFLKGLLDADGSRVPGAICNLHMCNKELLQEVQILAASLELDSTLTQTKDGWLLVFRNGVDRNLRPYPSDALMHDLNGQEVNCYMGDSASIAERAAFRRGRLNQAVAERIYSRLMPDKEVYRYDQIVDIKIHNRVETTYTLSVDDPLHQFVADGVIHKNTAADIVTEGMVVLSEYAQEVDDMEYQPVLNIHDDLTFELEPAHVDAKMPVIAKIMCKPRFDYINVPLIVECSTGRRWNELKEIMKYSSEQLFNLRNPYK